MSDMSRRTALQGALALTVAAPLAARAQTAAPEAHTFAPKPGAWRRFEVATSVTAPAANGETQLWLPAPDLARPFQRSLGDTWTGNATSVRLVEDTAKGVRLLHATFAADVAQPTLTLTSTVETQDRAVDWSARATPHAEPADLRRWLQPTALHPVDGIVRDTAQKAIGGATSDEDKVRAIYNWMVSTCFRDPGVKGCGAGEIKTMLESGNLGGKCADLSALFVAMSRSVGVPAREMYGVRLAPSAFGYKQLGATSASLTGAQHCRAEVWLSRYGWVAMDPADVLKVMRQETPTWIRDPGDALVAPVDAGLYGGWEGNWVAWNTVNDVALPGAQHGATVSFLMYPQGENAAGRFDELAPATFAYTIAAREIAV
ncbi:MAG TPA: transglutaminase domain-containing protein [Caulobacteraceae bacterium]|jgi:transglutaminase-like putative cysteine protease